MYYVREIRDLVAVDVKNAREQFHDLFEDAVDKDDYKVSYPDEIDKLFQDLLDRLS